MKDILIKASIAGWLIATPASACTVIAGMSQTWNTCQAIQGSGFSCLINTGDEIGNWANGVAWDGARTRAGSCRSATHVAVQLSAPNPSRNTRERVRNLSLDVVQQVRGRFPNVQRITLITSTGGPDGDLCPVRSDMRNTRNCVRVGNTCYVRSSHQYNSRNWLGMVDYAETDPGVDVFQSEVGDCRHYKDGKGHLSGSGRRYTAGVWEDELLTGDLPDIEQPGDCPVLNPGQSTYNGCYNWLGYTKPFSSQERREVKACVARCE